MGTKPLERATFDVRTLMSEHPPLLRDPNKKVVYDVACPGGCPGEGLLGYVRWSLFPLPTHARPSLILDRVQIAPTIYDYRPASTERDAVEWHVNFADPRLFFGYGGGLFAQDEMQVAEHPVLGSLVEALRAEGHVGVTQERGVSTPVLVTGAPRCCRVDTAADPAAGRPRGLYGNEFSAASPDVVRAATTRFDAPARTNVIAIAAPSYGVGPYARRTIECILTTAFTGFRAAMAESMRIEGPTATTVVHTGYWGCGAFGGNRVLMSLLQLVAAGMAGIDLVVFHTVNEGGSGPFREALGIMRDELPGVMASDDLLDRIWGMGFAWGMARDE